MSRFAPARARALHHAVRFAALLSCAMALPAAHGQPTTTLSTITITPQADAPLDTPNATGSYLGLTPLQTPASIQVVPRARIQAQGDVGVNEAITRAGAITSMAHPGNGLSALSSRGFTDSTSVMRLYDGLRQYGGVGLTFPFDTWSVERIDVLHGPASVIYGDGAIGGAINVVPRKPTRGAARHELQATIGTQRTARLGLGSGGALNDQWSYRLDASADTTGGWVDRGRSRDATFSGTLQWDPNPTWRVSLSHALGVQRPMRYFGTPLVDGKVLDAIRHRNYNVQDSHIRFRDQWTQLDSTWTPNDAATVRARLYHVRSERDWRNAERYLYNPRSGLIDRSDNTAISHEQQQTGLTMDATLRSRLGSLDHTVAIGFDVNRARFQHTNNTYAGSSGPVDPFRPTPGGFHSDAPTLPRYQNEATQYAVFLENRLALTPQWSVVAGLRHDRARVVRNDLISGRQALSRTYSNTGWRIGTVYEPMPGLSLYAQYAQAADPVSGLLMISPANSAFDMSTGRQVEVGVKQLFWEGRGAWTLAAYHIRKDNLLTRDALDPSLRVQVGSQSSRGVEATLSLAVADGWQIEANATLLRAQYDDFTETTGSPARAVSRRGKVPPNVAERMANVWVSWDFQPGWTAMGGLRYVGKRYADSANTLTLPAYTTVDLGLRWQVNAQTTVTARGYNVFNRAYFTTAYYTNTQWLYGPDRRFELTLNHRF